MPQLQCVNTLYVEKNGAGGETRTPNRPITNRVLYQLSHTSTVPMVYSKAIHDVKQKITDFFESFDSRDSHPNRVTEMTCFVLRTCK